MRCWMLFIACSLAAFSSGGTFAASSAAELSPLFVTGHPIQHEFLTVATGYGALSEDRRNVAAYFSGADSNKIKIGEHARVELMAKATTRETGRVVSVWRNADPKTGQGIITVTLAKQSSLPPRTYCSIDVTVLKRMSLAVPTTAVLILGGDTFVYKKTPNGNFKKTHVIVGTQGPEFTEIKKGLKLDDAILVQGALEWNQINSDDGGG